MKQLLLATALVVVPAAGFFAVMPRQPVAAAQASAGLGDLARFEAIVSDVQSIAATGDFTAAEKRVTDFETAWDAAEPELRARDAAAWGSVDDAADAAFSALRAGSPDKDSVTATLGALQAVLQAPVAGGAAVPVTLVAGVAVTDQAGHAFPCEEMLTTLRAAIKTGGMTPEKQARAAEFQAKATERCNADDDRRANEFTAQGIALATR